MTVIDFSSDLSEKVKKEAREVIYFFLSFALFHLGRVTAVGSQKVLLLHSMKPTHANGDILKLGMSHKLIHEFVNGNSLILLS